MAWKYAIFTVMAPELDLEQTAELAASLGFDGLEWRITKLSPEPITQFSYWSGNRSTVDVENIASELPRAKRIADRYHLQLPFLGTYISCHQIEVVESVMRVAADVGCYKMRVGPSGYDGTRPYGELYEETVRSFGKVADLAAKYGVQACIETHPGIITSSISLAYRVASNFDPAHIGVLYDPGNLISEGYERTQMALELLGPYLSHVHAKNNGWFKVGEQDGVAEWQAKSLSTSQGIVNWTEVMKALRKVGYDGWFSFEDFYTGDTRAKLTDGLSYLKRIETALG